MGFLSALTGGSSSSSSSGFQLLPQEIKDAYTKYATSATGYLPGAGGADLFKPMGETADEARGFGMIRGGFAPTEASIRSDVGMQMNPFDDFVIGEINRQAGGDYSLLKQAQNEAGQMGSNRGFLGANDIDLTRLNQIGGFKQSQYNTALQNALTTLPGMRSQDASNLLGIGGFQRGLDADTKQAPINNLLALAKILGILPTDGGSQEKKSSSGGFGSILQAGATAFGSSDIRLKEDISFQGFESGFPIYTFRYKTDPDKILYRGVMAHDVADIMPDAVAWDGDYMMVDYAKIGIEFARVQ